MPTKPALGPGWLYDAKRGALAPVQVSSDCRRSAVSIGNRTINGKPYAAFKIHCNIIVQPAKGRARHCGTAGRARAVGTPRHLKRPDVRVTLTDKATGAVVHEETRGAFNAGVRASEAAVRELARSEHANYAGERPVRVGDVYNRTWTSARGRVVVATIVNHGRGESRAVGGTISFKTAKEAAEAYKRLKAEQYRAPDDEQWTYGERLKRIKAAWSVLHEEESLGIRRRVGKPARKASSKAGKRALTWLEIVRLAEPHLSYAGADHLHERIAHVTRAMVYDDANRVTEADFCRVAATVAPNVGALLRRLVKIPCKSTKHTPVSLLEMMGEAGKPRRSSRRVGPATGNPREGYVHTGPGTYDYAPAGPRTHNGRIDGDHVQLEVTAGDKLKVTRIPLRGGYTTGKYGQYRGGSTPLFIVENLENDRSHEIRAASYAAAKAKVAAAFPMAKVAR